MERFGKIAVVCAIGALVLVGGFAIWATSFSFTGTTSYVVTLEADPIQPDRIAENATTNVSDRERRVVGAALANDSVVVLDERIALERQYVVYDGSYVKVAVRNGSGTVRSRPVVQFDPVSDDGEPGRAVDSLPHVDQEAVGAAARLAQSETHTVTDPDPPWDRIYRTRSEIDASVLVTGSVDRVRTENRTFRVRVTERNVTLETKRVTARRVARNESAFRDAIVHNATTALSDSETAPLREAIHDGPSLERAENYSAAWEPLDALASLCEFDRSAIQKLDRGDRAVCYVRYEGAYYRLRVGAYASGV